jgi:hypothetical protein
MCEATDILYLPRYKDGDWIDGKPKTISFEDSNNLALLRVPVLKIKDNTYFLLDGYHRIKTYKPILIIMDVLHVKQEYMKYFIDMHNGAWRNLI